MQINLSATQKKLKDCLTEMKQKKEKVDEQDGIIKKLQERL